jgi:hypothetical protein
MQAAYFHSLRVPQLETVDHSVAPSEARAGIFNPTYRQLAFVSIYLQVVTAMYSVSMLVLTSTRVSVGVGDASDGSTISCYPLR